MKQVFTAPSVVPCDLVKSVLEDAGIECMIKNERGSAIAGYGYPMRDNPSLFWAWPEVWVNDKPFEVACRIVTDLQNPSPELIS